MHLAKKHLHFKLYSMRYSCKDIQMTATLLLYVIPVILWLLKQQVYNIQSLSKEYPMQEDISVTSCTHDLMKHSH